MSIVVVGSVAYDDVETPVESRKRVPGGSATYFCHAASYFSRTKLVGIVGSDFMEEHLQMLRDLNVDLEGLQIAEGDTFHWACRYENNMNDRETLFTKLGVFENFEPNLPDSYRTADYVFLANIHPDLQLHVVDQVEKPKLIAADSMNLWIDIALDSLKKLISKVDIFIINDQEAKMLTGERHLPSAADKILDMGPDHVIIKLGEFGVSLYGKDGYFMAPAFPVGNAADPTGAGDSFAGGFMGYIAKTDAVDFESLKRAVIFGSTMGSFAVEKFGFDRFQNLDEKQILERAQQFKRITKFEL